MKLRGAKTKKEAVVTAIMDFNRRKRLERVIDRLGTFDNVMSQDELRRMRDDEVGLLHRDSHFELPAGIGGGDNKA